MLVVYLGGLGAWPITVDAALARIVPERRGAMSSAWNVREYLTIGASSISSGILFQLGGAHLPLAVATVLLASALLAAPRTYRRPIADHTGSPGRNSLPASEAAATKQSRMSATTRW